MPNFSFSLSDAIKLGSMPYERARQAEEDKLLKQKTLADITAQQNDARYKDSLINFNNRKLDQEIKMQPLEYQIKQQELETSKANTEFNMKRLNQFDIKNQQDLFEHTLALGGTAAMGFAQASKDHPDKAREVFNGLIDQYSEMAPKGLKENLQKLKGMSDESIVNLPALMSKDNLETAAKAYKFLKDGDINSLNSTLDKNPERLSALTKATDANGNEIFVQSSNIPGQQPQVVKGITPPKGNSGKPVYKEITVDGKRYYHDLNKPFDPNNPGYEVPKKTGELFNIGEVPRKDNSGLVDLVGYDKNTRERVVLEEGVPSKASLDASAKASVESNQKYADKSQEGADRAQTEKVGLGQITKALEKSNVNFGPLSDYKTLAIELAHEIPGLKSLINDETVGPTQLVNSVMAGLRLEAIGGGSLAGVSNYEEQIVKDMMPSLTQSEVGFKLMMDFRNSFIDRKLALNENIQNVHAEGLANNTPVNLHTATIDWLKKNPIEKFIPKATEERAEQITGKTLQPESLSMPRQTPQSSQEPQMKIDSNKMYFSRKLGGEKSGQDIMDTWSDPKVQQQYPTRQDFLNSLQLE